MNITPIGAISPTGNAAIDQALNLLTEAGISFEVVDRCPTECPFCDEALPHAA